MTHERKLEVIYNYMMLLLKAYFHTVNATWIEAIHGVVSDSKIFLSVFMGNSLVSNRRRSKTAS